MKHIIAYEGCVRTSLALMQKAYVPQFVPWTNWRTNINGTLQRPPYSILMGEEWITSLDKSKGKDEVFAVLAHQGNARKRTYRYIGHMGIHHIVFPDARATTGSILGATGGRGKGYGTEAKLLVLKHAFDVLGLRKLTSSVKGWNAQSLGHLIKCGYRVVGRYSKHVFHEGKFVDEILLEVFREDWEPIWKNYQETKKLPKLTDEQRALVSKETST